MFRGFGLLVTMLCIVTSYDDAEHGNQMSHGLEAHATHLTSPTTPESPCPRLQTEMLY